MRRADPGPDQPALFAPPPEPEQVRAAGDPHIYLPANPRPTQVEAAAKALPMSVVQRRRVFEAIRRAGRAGLTDQEIQRELGLDGNTERPRRGELERAGQIVESGEKRPTASGGQAIVWVIAEGVA